MSPQTTVVATGQLRHRFWGEYSALISLIFKSPSDLDAVLYAGHFDPALTGWTMANFKLPGHDLEGRALIWVGNSAALKGCKDYLAERGAERKAIDSVAHSIDYGDPFSISVTLGVVEDPRQLQLGLGL